MATNHLIFGALSRALKTSYFHRDGGAEEQAGKKLEDFVPDEEELLTYWGNVINYLMSMDGENQSKAQEIIIGKFKSQYIEGNNTAIIAAIKHIIQRTGELSNELRQQFTDLITDRFPIENEQKLLIQELLDDNRPTDIKELLAQTVIASPYQSERTAKGYVDLASEKAMRFARELVENKNWSWLEELENLQKGEQRQTFAFAQEIGKIAEIKDEIIDKAIVAFSKIKFEEQNESFISGFVSGVNSEDFARGTIDKLLAEPNARYHAIRLGRFLNIKIEDLNKLIPVVDENPDYIVGFQYLKYEGLKDAEVIKFFTWLSEVSAAGNWLAIDIIQQLIEKDETIFFALRDLVIFLIRKKEFIKNESINQLSFCQYELLVTKLINEGIEDDLVVFLAEEIKEVCKGHAMSGELHFSSILNKLLDAYWDQAWPVIGAAILDITFDGWYGVKSILSGYKNFKKEIILEWVSKNLPNAPVYTLMFIEIETSDAKGKAVWSPIVKALIDLYGEDNRFLQELSARLHSYSVTGSAIPLFTRRLQLVQTLLGHSIPAINNFAEQEITYFNRLLGKEQKWQENLEIGEIDY